MSRQAKNYLTTKGKEANSSSKGSGKRNTNKRKFKSNNTTRSVSDYDSIDGRGLRHNDVSWYTPDAQILNDAARLPYSIPVGMPYSRAYLNQNTVGIDRAEPGVLTQFVMPTYGKSDDPHSAINVASQGIYTFVRHMNSGSRNYDPTDLTIYLLAMDSLFSMVAWGTRTYATLCTYHQGNRYLPKMLLRAQHLNFDDFANNIAQFRAGLNQRISKLGNLVVPNVMPIFQRHAWIFSNYYIEGDNIKDQIYQYAPEGFYKFTLDSDGAGMLQAIDARQSETLITMNGFFSTMDMLIDAIFMEEDFGTMSGDILKAYDSNVLRLQYIPDMVNVAFQYDESVLLQFKNSKSHSVNRKTASPTHDFEADFFNIVQSTNKDYLKVVHPLTAINGIRRSYDRGTTVWTDINLTSPANKASALLAGHNWLEWSKDTLLTSPHTDVSAEENMVNTRGTMAFKVAYDSTYQQDYVVQDYAMGSEWYTNFSITWATRDRSTLAVTIHHLDLERVVTIAIDANQGYSDAGDKSFQLNHYASLLSRFKYHPEVKFLVFAFDDVTATNPNFTHNLRDLSNFEVDNYTVQAFDIISNMHNTAILGEFNVPKIAISAS